jgi:hypothetical protein
MFPVTTMDNILELVTKPPWNIDQCLLLQETKNKFKKIV